MKRIEIQFQSLSGNWTTITVTDNISTNIADAMRQAKSQRPDCRVRAIDQGTGQLVDMLG